MMVMVMLLGLSAMQLSKSQLSLSSNLQFQEDAFNQAEAAIVSAEHWLSTGTNYQAAGFNSSSSPGLYPMGYLSTDIRDPRIFPVDPLTMSWDDRHSIQGSDDNQRYLIGQIAIDKKLESSGAGLGGRMTSGCNQVNTYRIIARGASSRGATKFVQVIYSVLNC
jgi:Tfp pilus assembly protein PilX